MRTRHLCLLPALLAGLLGAAVCRAERHALLVGVNQYPNFNGRDLSGAVHDVENLAQVLIREYGFPAANVRIVTDAQATLEGIRRAFAELAAAARGGDTVLFHFSGHGMYLPDDNADEDDGLDEALCPHDTSPLGTGALRDDELGRLLDALPADEVVVTLDCCYSGSATKAIRPGVVPRFLPAPAAAKAIGVRAKSVTAPAIGGDVESTGGGQRRVVFSACAAAQEALELRHRLRPDVERLSTGMLTYFLVEGLRGPADTNRDGSVSYAEAFAHVRRQIDAIHNRAQGVEASRQTPMLEVSTPSLADQPIFGVGRKQPMFAKLTDLEPGRITLDLGAIHGLKPSQTFRVYRSPSLAKDPHSELGRLGIAQLGFRTAQARLLSGGPLHKGCIAVPLPDARDTPPTRIWLRTDPNLAQAHAQTIEALRQRMATLADRPPICTLGDGRQHDLLVTLSAGQGELSVAVTETNGRTHGPRTWPLPAAAGATQDQASQQTMAWVSQLAAGLRDRMSLAMLSNPAGSFGLQAVVDRRPAPGSTLAEYRVGDRLKFGLKSTADCWYYILACDPTGNVTLWCPQPGGQHFAPAGRKLLYPGPGETLQVDGPPGVYVAKLLAVRRRLAPESLRAGIPTAAALHALPATDWSETSVSFRVVSP